MVSVKKIGEFGLIERFRKQLKTDASVVMGSGDDCAVLRFNRRNFQLFTCDTIVEGIDFTPKDEPYLIGRKALAVSISDVAACAGLPRHCVISLSLPEKTQLRFVNRVLKGMLDIAAEFKMNIVGGDISRSDKLAITSSVLGSVEKKYLCLRSGAQDKDIIFTSGPLGGSISGGHLKFNPRVKEARYLAQNFRINSMIDVSDGLAADLGQILKASNKGAFIYQGLIPVNKGSSLKDALYMGEDYELLFSAPLNSAREIIKRTDRFKPIGEITAKAKGFNLVDSRGTIKSLKPQGFRHF